MKQLNRINQFLLKRYPLIWNTRITWLLILALLTHLFFFLLGFWNLNDPVSLHKHNVAYDFLDNGIFLLGILISIILIFGWLIFMLKNNSFKSFYPTSKNQLFSHFLIYFIIIFSNTTYYYSYFYGMKTSVILHYSDSVVERDIRLANKTAPFFSHYLNEYEINNKQFPSFFRGLYCETNSELINFKKPYLKFLEDSYQYYTLKKIKKNRKEKLKNDEMYLFVDVINDSTDLFYSKDTVIDISKRISTVLPSYFNFSNIFFDIDGAYNGYYYDEYTGNRRFRKDSLTIEFVLTHNILLEKNDPLQIKKLLDDFLLLANKYKIATNLTTESWFPLINTDSFLLKKLIKNKAPLVDYQVEYGYQDWDRKVSQGSVRTFDDNGNRIKTVRDEFIAKLKTDFYLESNKLRNAFYNINQMKTKNPFEETIHFFLWFSFFLTSIVFIYRISGLRSLIFSVLTFGVLGVLLLLIALSYNGLLGNSFLQIETFMACFTWIIGTLILSIPIFYLKKMNKMVTSICINISLSCFAIYLFLILVLISIFQNHLCKLKYKSYEEQRLHCQTIIQYFDIDWSFILFGMTFIFLYFFMEKIRKWRALPEIK